MTDSIRPLNSITSGMLPRTESEEKPFQTKDQSKLRSTFDEAVASTFYRQMFKAMRTSTGKAGLITDSQTERMFQQQLDEVLIERMSKATGGTFSDDLFEQQFRNLNSSEKTDSRPPRGTKFEADA